MIASAFFFHLVSAIVIIALVVLVVKLRSKINFLRSIFQLLKHSDGQCQRRRFVSDPRDFLTSFSRVFGIEIQTPTVTQPLKKIDVSTLLKLHCEHQITAIQYCFEKTEIHVEKMLSTEESSQFEKELLLDFPTQKIVFLKTKIHTRVKVSNLSKI